VHVAVVGPNAATPDDLAAARAVGRLLAEAGATAADAVIAIGGSWGTLSEIALARRAGVPVVCLGGWEVVGGALDRVPDPATAVAQVLRPRRS
jgi:SLOG cluster4 family